MTAPTVDVSALNTEADNLEYSANVRTQVVQTGRALITAEQALEAAQTEYDKAKTQLEYALSQGQ